MFTAMPSLGARCNSPSVSVDLVLGSVVSLQLGPLIWDSSAAWWSTLPHTALEPRRWSGWTLSPWSLCSRGSALPSAFSTWRAFLEFSRSHPPTPARSTHSSPSSAGTQMDSKAYISLASKSDAGGLPPKREVWAFQSLECSTLRVATLFLRPSAGQAWMFPTQSSAPGGRARRDHVTPTWRQSSTTPSRVHVSLQLSEGS